MTSHAQRRCRHCGVRYAYQASGYGCHEALNDGQWCPDCYKVICDALKAVPKKVERVLIPTTEVTAFKLEAIEDERAAEAKAAGRLHARRITPGLFDMVDPSNVESRGITWLNGKTYRWSYWSKDPEGTAEVRVEMERDLQTGEEVPWVNYR